MKKTTNVFMVITGAIPFVLGGIQNKLMMVLSYEVLPFYLLAALFWLFWGVLAFFFYQKVKNTKTIVVLLNAVAAVDLLLLGIQEFIVQAYWMNVVGSWSQLFYLPLIKVGFTLANWSHTMFTAYVVSFILMVAASILGCKISISYSEMK